MLAAPPPPLVRLQGPPDATAGAARAVELLENRQAENTRTAYGAAWGRFEAWAASQGLDALPAQPGTVAAYVGALDVQQKAPSSIGIVLAAISDRHRAAGHPSPTRDPGVVAVRAGLRRSRKHRPRRAAPLTPAELRPLLARLRGNVAGARDRALVLLGWAAALRRSELVALDVADLRSEPAGIAVEVRSSKTDQIGEGETIPVHRRPMEPDLCPVLAVEAWLKVRGTEPGPLFVSVRGRAALASRLRPVAACRRLDAAEVSSVVKRLAAAAGVDPSRLSGHSLRSGFATTAAEGGAEVYQIARVTRHKDLAVLLDYIRFARVFGDDPLRQAGMDVEQAAALERVRGAVGAGRASEISPGDLSVLLRLTGGSA